LPFGLAFPTLSDLSDPISSGFSPSRVPAFAFPLSGGSDFIRSFAPNLPAEFFRFIGRGFVEI
ncbi:hypothetical protein, partial [Streptomyces prasinus]|uniref:hypothetical protein n=1 Tax=Streptomyces prasinus TaxID=67345 RepID=UPI003627455E